MSKNKFISFLDTGIFTATVMFCVGYGYDEIITRLKKYKNDKWHITLRGDKDFWDSPNYAAMRRTADNIVTGESVTSFVIKIRDSFEFTDYEYCKLAHECLHICQYLLPDFLDRNQENEAEAYLHTHLMNQCLIELRKHFKPIKHKK